MGTTTIRPIDWLLSRLIRAHRSCWNCKDDLPEGQDRFCTDLCAEQHQNDFAL